MNHEHCQVLISQHIDNELDDVVSAELFGHLATCKLCRNFMRVTMNVRAQLSKEGLSEVSPSMDRRILGFEPRSTAAMPGRPWFAPLWRTRISMPLPAAASLVFLILFCTVLLSPLLTSRTSQSRPYEDLKNVPVEFQKQLEMYR